ncbi:MAG: hypothetical protein OXC14_01340 [Rhodospirillaceae bacterium]|nr:hypothetical protein [Rhodospirillaceae bacterium]
MSAVALLEPADEAHPRGQFNAQATMAEAMTEGAWWRLFNEPNLRKFIDPSVYGSTSRRSA